MIIGVTGYKRSGKNEVGKVLEQFGYHQVALADGVKSMALAINPIVRAYSFPKHPERLATIVSLLGWEKAKEDPEVRGLLQRIGTEAVRETLGAESWIKALQTRITGIRVREGITNFVVTDVRFPNEGRWVHGLGGTVWRITREGCEGDGHASETEVAKVQADLTITNDGTLEELWDRVVAVMPQ